MALTLKQLIDFYRSDLDSPFQKLRYQVRIKQSRTFDRISEKYGRHQLRGIKAPTLVYWYKVSGSGGRTAAAYDMIARLRALFKFGFTLLEDTECKRLAEILRESRFGTQGPRLVQLTAENVQAIRRTAREHFGWYSIALVQAFQFELRLSQKDVIGEWVPIDEPGSSDFEINGRKWLRGLRWSDIDKNLILRHATGSSGRPIEVDLKKAPMVLAELKAIGLDIAALPTSGPIIINDVTGLPWSTTEFRRKWRLVAKKAGVPDVVKNRDSVPTGTIVGGPDQTPVSQRITLARIDQSLRRVRR
ncbi:hypothetical protein [Bradyrhizobium sp. CSA207]|uniref:hypothetical protein n=1 Tax=Bradyrhizobium sp. CSA207 TaxID=2698826 RepID=UPI0023AECB38|nr:hypothetical protein [Bradyrhizobium sp. CSA207]